MARLILPGRPYDKPCQGSVSQAGEVAGSPRIPQSQAPLHHGPPVVNSHPLNKHVIFLTNNLYTHSTRVMTDIQLDTKDKMEFHLENCT